MKVCIISSRNLRIYPLTKIYIDIFEKYNITYDVIYMDRLGVEERCSANRCYKYTWLKQAITDNNMLSKVQNYVNYKRMLTGFRRFVDVLLKENEYDFIVLWGEETVYCIADICVREYPKKYSVNIRDIWDQKNKKMNEIIKDAVRHSAFNTVSSDGFIPYLPPSDYLFVHSANEEVIESVSPKTCKKDNPIVILSIGSFRNDRYSFDIMDCFANDERFVMKFVGPGSERMLAYCDSKGYKNVVCSGNFAIEDTAKLLEDASIINCAYGADDIAETSKMPIRFYYSIYREVPILMTEGTRIQYYGDLVRIGITLPAKISDKPSIANDVYMKYRNIDMTKLKESISSFKEQINESHYQLEKRFLKENKIEL